MPPSPCGGDFAMKWISSECSECQDSNALLEVGLLHGANVERIELGDAELRLIVHHPIDVGQ